MEQRSQPMPIQWGREGESLAIMEVHLVNWSVYFIISSPHFSPELANER